MNIAHLKNELSSLKLQMEHQISEPENERWPIYDGAVNLENYLASPLKIAWLLKEAYDGEEGTGGGWDYSDLLGKDTVYEDFFKNHKSKSTWHPIIYVSYGILNGFKLWGEMKYIRDDPDMSFVVRQLAIINIQKLPAKGITVSNYWDIREAFDKHHNILQKQLELLDPDIIIGGNTMSHCMEMFGLKQEEGICKESIGYYIKNNKLYIDAYHPAQRLHKREIYVDEIVSACKEFYQKHYNEQKYVHY